MFESSASYKDLLRILTLIDNGPPLLTLSINPCKKPMIRTSPGGKVMAKEVSMIGKLAIDRLVDIRFPLNGPLPAMICIGVVGKLVAGSMVSGAFSSIKH